jgi:precorrin-6A synthase
MRRIRLVGIGSGGPDQVTVEAVKALSSVDFFVVTDKVKKDGSPDPLVAARTELLARHLDHEPTLVVVTDPERDRDDSSTGTRSGYEGAVSDWHEARAEAYEQALLDHDGDAGFLVWGDPAFYDSTVRVLERVLERGRVEAELDVVPGISSLQMLAARHRIVLHEVGQPVLITTGRRLRDAVDAGQDNLVVMLNRSLEPLDSLGDWQIWWGANLGTPDEQLVAGRVADVIPAIEAAREAVKERAGWVMDVYVLRRVIPA